MATSIPVGRGDDVVVIDDDDEDLIRRFSWHLVPGHSTSYASTHINGKTVYMHRLLLGMWPKQHVDHVNGHGLDNRRTNLRLASRSDNAANSKVRPKRAARSSRFKGVSWHETKTGGCWRAEVEKQTDGKRKRFIRYAHTEAEAARLYNELAREQFGTFAKGNT